MNRFTHLLLAAAIVAGSNFSLRGANITVGFAEGTNIVEVPISVDDPNPLAAAFTVTFDTSALDVQVTSSFFGSFASQYTESGALMPRATSVSVGGREYTSPLVVSPLAGRGLAVAGVRRQPAGGSPSTLLTLRVALRAGAALGLYTINVEPTVVRLAAAGYNLAGEAIHLLVGRNRASDAYPVILGADGAAMHIVPGLVRFRPNDPDSDHDGISDVWERQYFGNLTTVSANTDSDGDGLPDIVEYFMGSDPTRAESSFVIRGVREGSVFKMLFAMSTTHDLNYAAEWSADLREWSASGIRINLRSDLGGGAGWSMMEASLPTGGAARLFLRLNIHRQSAGN